VSLDIVASCVDVEVWFTTLFLARMQLSGHAERPMRRQMAWDRVYTLNDYYDGPRLGIADVYGVPHIYEAEFDYSSEEYGDTFFVSPADGDLFALVIEDWDIWLRWDAAFKRGEVSIDTHPALPNDRERHEALKIAIGGRLKADRSRAKYKRARFGVSPQTGENIVEWCDIPDR
jgi:hypothetical protein